MRWEIIIRRSRRHQRTLYVEADDILEIENCLFPVRKPVLLDVMKRMESVRRQERLHELKKTDFFDAKGDDISYEEYYENEAKAVLR